MTRLLILSFAAAGLLAGCSDPTATARYPIAPAPAAKALPDKLGQAELREVSLPQYASGQEIAWQTEDGALRSSPENIWADDPPRAVTLALARQISEISGATVIAEPWPLSEGPARRIEVRVAQLMARAEGVLVLEGTYYVTPADLGGGRDLVRNFALSVPIEGADKAAPGAIAAAQSRAVALLAERIARLD